MNSLSEALQPYKEGMGQVASVLTIAQFFTGSFICKNVYKKGNTQGISAVPFIGSIAIGILVVNYALMLNDPAMLQVNIASILLNMIYLVFYTKYSENIEQNILKPITYGVLIVAVILGYAFVESENLEFRYGLALTVLQLLLLAFPLLDLKKIINKKDASAIPLPMTFMSAVVTFLWFIYGIILRNDFMMVQNATGFILCFLQLILVVLYPGPAKSFTKQS